MSEEMEDEIVENDLEETDDVEMEEEEKEELDVDERSELERLRKKDYNFKEMRGKTKKDKADIKKSRAELDQEQESFREDMILERKEDALTMLIGDDKESRKKALFNFNRIDSDVPATTKEEIFKRMKEAVNMTGRQAAPNTMGAGGHSGYRGTPGAKKESEASIAMRKQSGISDEEKKEYGGDDWNPTY